MPKFRIMMDRTVHYKGTVDVDADSEEEARAEAEEMGISGEILGINTDDIQWSIDDEEVDVLQCAEV